MHNGFFLTGELVYGGEHALWRYDGAEPPQTRMYLRDAMGSVIGLMDPQGNLVDTFEYDAFGSVRGGGGAALPSNLGGDSRFQGMWKDTGTGLYYVRARYYDARTGRFLSRDPAEGQLEQPESFYPYVFANGNPWVFRDPTGRISLPELEFRRLGQAALEATANAARAFARGVLRSLRAVRDVSFRVAGRPLPNLGNKLEFLFGNATGFPASVKRSIDLARQLNRIGIFNNPSGRARLVEHFAKVVRNPANIAKVKKNGRVVRESLLAGRNGLLKVQSVWEGNKLITVFLFGG